MKISRLDFLKKVGLAASGAFVLGDAIRALAADTPAVSTSTNAPAPGNPPVVSLSTNAPAAGGLTPTLQPLLGEYQTSAHFVNSGPGFGRRLAITFDDGPTPGVTERVLEELRKRDIKSSFFMIGQRIVAYPDLCKKVFDDGHEVCNHSFTHPQLSKMPDMAVSLELERCQEAVDKAIGRKPVWCRPPYGAFRKTQGHLAVALGLGVVYWSVDPRDWAQPGAEKLIQIVPAQSRPGSIILMHDLHSQTADAVPAILDKLLEQEYEFTTISGFLGNPYEV
jgi:peptidoglycan-N-acetylglucosamine deacetylase